MKQKNIRITKYDMKIVLENCNVKIGREEIQPTI